MSEQKRYTAQEMRIVADNMLDVFVNGDYSRSDVCAMLRQAADMRERCEEEHKKILRCIEVWPNHKRETVYAEQLLFCLERIRGDAGKEEK